MLFYLPSAANGQVGASVQGPQDMPLPSAAERANKPGIYKVVYPVKPGETQFQVRYVLPLGTPFTFRGRLVNVEGHGPAPLRLVTSSGVTINGEDIQNVGTEPKTQTTIYSATAPNDFSVDITGTGAFHITNEETDTAQICRMPDAVLLNHDW